MTVPLVTTMAVSRVGNGAPEVVLETGDTEFPEAGADLILIVMMDFDVVDAVIELRIPGLDPPKGAVMIG